MRQEYQCTVVLAHQGAPHLMSSGVSLRGWSGGVPGGLNCIDSVKVLLWTTLQPAIRRSTTTLETAIASHGTWSLWTE